MHGLVVVPGRPLGSGRVQEEGAHVLGHAGVDVRVALQALPGTGGCPRSGGLVPPSHCLVRHLHNHELLIFWIGFTRTKNDCLGRWGW